MQDDKRRERPRPLLEGGVAGRSRLHGERATCGVAVVDSPFPKTIRPLNAGGNSHGMRSYRGNLTSQLRSL